MFVVASVYVVFIHAVAVLIVGDILGAVSLPGATVEVVSDLIVVVAAFAAVILFLAAVNVVDILVFVILLDAAV